MPRVLLTACPYLRQSLTVHVEFGDFLPGGRANVEFSCGRSGQQSVFSFESLPTHLFRVATLCGQYVESL